jgi:hypothetical protein
MILEVLNLPSHTTISCGACSCMTGECRRREQAYTLVDGVDTYDNAVPTGDDETHPKALRSNRSAVIQLRRMTRKFIP